MAEFEPGIDRTQGLNSENMERFSPIIRRIVFNQLRGYALQEKEELSQETHMKAWIKSKNVYHEQGEIERWIAKVAKNAALNWKRDTAHRRNDELPLTYVDQKHSHPSAETILIRQEQEAERQDEIARGYDELMSLINNPNFNSRYRDTLLILKECIELDTEHLQVIADRMNTTVGGAKSLLHRAKQAVLASRNG